MCSHVYLKTEHNVDWGHRNISSILSQLMGSLCLARSLSLRRMKMASMPVALASQFHRARAAETPLSDPMARARFSHVAIK